MLRRAALDRPFAAGQKLHARRTRGFADLATIRRLLTREVAASPWPHHVVVVNFESMGVTHRGMVMGMIVGLRPFPSLMCVLVMRVMDM